MMFESDKQPQNLPSEGALTSAETAKMCFVAGMWALLLVVLYQADRKLLDRINHPLHDDTAVVFKKPVMIPPNYIEPMSKIVRERNIETLNFLDLLIVVSVGGNTVYDTSNARPSSIYTKILTKKH